MPTGLARYGLNENPFWYGELGELNPLVDEVAERLLAHVDGFEVVDKTKAKIAQAVADQQPLFFMIAGGSGSGRTSLVNWLLSQFAVQRDIDREHVKERLIVPRDAYPSPTPASPSLTIREPGLVFKDWMKFLRNRVNREYKLLDPLPGDIARVTQAAVDAADLQDIAWRVNRALVSDASQKGAFAIVLEDVQTQQIVSYTLAGFADVPTLVVYTCSNSGRIAREIVSPFRESSKSDPTLCPIDLGTLDGKDARALVEHRWEKWLNAEIKIDSPFDPNGIEAYFTKRNLPVKRVLLLVGKVLQEKVADGKEGDAWPTDNQLSITAAELQTRIDDNLRVLPYLSEGPGG